MTIHKTTFHRCSPINQVNTSSIYHIATHHCHAISTFNQNSTKVHKWMTPPNIDAHTLSTSSSLATVTPLSTFTFFLTLEEPQTLRLANSTKATQNMNVDVQGSHNYLLILPEFPKKSPFLTRNSKFFSHTSISHVTKEPYFGVFLKRQLHHFGIQHLA